MEDQLPTHNIIIKKNKIRVCHIIPLILENIQADSKLEASYEQLQSPSSASSQAVAVAQIASVSLNGSDDLFAEGLSILVKVLLQCPLKANLAEKVIGSLNSMRKERQDLYDAVVTKALLTHLKNASTELYGALCQVLALVQTSSLLANSDIRPKNGRTKLCHGDLTISALIADNRGQLASSASEDCWPNKLKLHEAVCDALQQSLASLREVAFNAGIPHMVASANQQLLQQMVNCALGYLQSLMPFSCPSSCVPETITPEGYTFSSQSHLAVLKSFSNSHVPRIADTILKVLACSNSTLDLRLVCGQMIAVLSSYWCGGPSSLMTSLMLAHNRSPGTTQPNGCASDVSFSESVELPTLPVLGHIAVLHGILCTVPADQLFVARNHISADTCSSSQEMGENDTSGYVLGIAILEQALQHGSCPDHSELVLSCSRLLNHWSLRTLSHKGNCKLLSNLMPVAGQLESKLLDHLWFTWEHYLDRVKHTTYETFMNYLEMRKIALEEEADKYFMSVIESQIHLVPQKKAAVHLVRCLLKYVSVQRVLKDHPTLPHLLVKSLSDFSRAGCCSEAIKALFSKHALEVDKSTWQAFWIPTLFDAFQADMMTFGYELLVKNLLAANSSCLQFAINHLLKHSRNLSYDRFMLLISCVKVVRNSNDFKTENDPNSDTMNSQFIWRHMLPYTTIQSGLFHMDERVQICAFGLLCESKKTTEVLEPQELSLILEFFRNGLCIDVPSQRQVLVAFAKKLFFRIRDSTNFLTKSLENERRKASLSIEPNSVNVFIGDLAAYTLFCEQLFDLLLDHLHSSSRYPRRCCTLLLLQHMQEILLLVANSSVSHALKIDRLISKPVYTHNLIDVLNDNYETNKVITLQLLRSNPFALSVISEAEVNSLLECVHKMASSCKPSDSLTASYLLQFIMDHPLLNKKIAPESPKVPLSLVICREILSILKVETSVASQNVLEAAAHKPMHGQLSCLRSVLVHVPVESFRSHRCDWSGFIEELIEVCKNAHISVRTIVENDSPEGNIPMDLSEVEEIVANSLGNRSLSPETKLVSIKPGELPKATGISAQMLLLCAWRTVKEVSLLLGDLLYTLPLPPAGDAALNVAAVTKIGEYFLTVLEETKHRGAFEQTYTGFLKVCERLWLSKDDQLSKLPNKWVDDILNDIKSESEDKFCATRRSAGIPFIVQAVLATEPTTQGGACLKKTMESLLLCTSDATYDNSFTRLHAFNILRALYKDTKLGDVIIPFVSDGVKSAIEGFSSTWWSIRNSATLLFAALITRMLGVKRNKDDLHSKNSMSGMVFFKRFPDLYSFLLDKLEDGARDIVQGQLAASLYPVLLLLARLSPAPLQGVSSSISLTRFIPHVKTCTESQIFQLRNLAARALGPLVNFSTLKATVEALCDQASWLKQNAVHGALLSLYQLLQTFCSQVNSDEMRDAILSSVSSLVLLATHENPCPVNQGVAIDIFQLLINEKWLEKNSDIVLTIQQSVIDQTRRLRTVVEMTRYIPGFCLFERSAAVFVLDHWELRSELFSEEGDDVLELLLGSQSPEVRELTLHAIGREGASLNTFQQCLSMLPKEDDTNCRIAIYDFTVSLLRVAREPTVAEKVRDIVDYIRIRPMTYLLDCLLSRLYDETEDAPLVQEEELSHAIPLLFELFLQTNQIRHHEQVCELCRQLVQWSDGDRHPAVRVSAAGATRALLHRRLIDGAGDQLHAPPANDEVLRSLLECTCLQLQDDDADVRSQAANIWTTMLALAYDPTHKEDTTATIKGEPAPEGLAEQIRTLGLADKPRKDGDAVGTALLFKQAAQKAILAAVRDGTKEGDGFCQGPLSHLSTMRPAQVLKALLHFMGAIGGSTLVSLLVAIALKEIMPAEFGLAPSDDRAFDKGEVNVHTEELIVTSHVCEVLSTLPHLRSLRLSLSLIAPHLHSLSGPDNTALSSLLGMSLPLRQHSNAPAEVTVSQFLDCLTEEIYSITFLLGNCGFGDLCKRLAGTDEWLTRLGRRAMLFDALSRGSFRGYAIAQTSYRLYDAEKRDHRGNPAGNRYDPFYETKRLMLLSPLQTSLVLKIQHLLRAPDEVECKRSRYFPAEKTQC